MKLCHMVSYLVVSTSKSLSLNRWSIQDLCGFPHSGKVNSATVQTYHRNLNQVHFLQTSIEARFTSFQPHFKRGSLPSNLTSSQVHFLQTSI